jgi:hypothetical protein
VRVRVRARARDRVRVGPHLCEVGRTTARSVEQLGGHHLVKGLGVRG